MNKNVLLASLLVTSFSVACGSGAATQEASGATAQASGPLIAPTGCTPIVACGDRVSVFCDVNANVVDIETSFVPYGSPPYTFKDFHPVDFDPNGQKDRNTFLHIPGSPAVDTLRYRLCTFPQESLRCAPDGTACQLDEGSPSNCTQELSLELPHQACDPTGGRGGGVDCGRAGRPPCPTDQP